MSTVEIVEAVMITLQGLALILLLAQAYRVNLIGRELKDITEQVNRYLKIVMDSETGGTAEKPSAGNDEENRLIAEVLQEIFP
jgi:hypothetical protein